MIGAGIDRRKLLGVVAPAALGLGVARPASTKAAVSNDLQTWIKLIADLNGRTVFSLTQGMVWGFKPQADDLTTSAFARRLYGYRSLAARKAQVMPDGGVRLRTKAWSFYLDRESGEPVAELLNPYTGAMVACPPLSGPTSSTIYGPAATAGPDLVIRRIGPHAWVEVDRISRFKPADTTWFKLEADMTTYACAGADLDRHAATHIPSTWSHSLTAEWQTWMKMHGQPGHILFNGAGATLSDAKAISSSMRAAVDRVYPGGLAEVLAWT